MTLLPVPAAWWAGTDYIRMTAKDGRDADMATVYERAAYTVVAGTSAGQVEFEPWAWKGYYGERCGSVAYGSGAQGHLLQVAGWQAQEEVLLRVPHDNLARWDVQLTLWFEREVPSIARSVAESSVNARASVSHRPWKVALIEGYGGGDTTYIGSRSSDSFLRVYDKWREAREAEEWRYSWRFEVELKDERANENWPVAGAPSPGPYWYAGLVSSAFWGRGVKLPSLEQVPSVPLAHSPAKATTTESRLAWLHNQVRPTVDKLLAQGVSLSRVLEALGLDGAS